MKKLLANNDIIFKEQAESYREALTFGNGKFGGLVYRPSYWEWVAGKLDVDIDIHKDYKQDKDPAIFISNKRNVGTSPPYKEILKTVEKKDGAMLDKLRKAQIDKWLSKRTLTW